MDWTCTKISQSGWADRQRNFHFHPGFEHASLWVRSNRPTRFHGQSLSTCSSSSYGSAAVAVNERDKQRLVGCGSTLLVMSAQSGIWKITLLLQSAIQRWINWPCAIRTKADAVKCAAKFCLVFRMTLQVAQFMHAMSELTLITVFAFASFLEWTTQFRLVAGNESEKIVRNFKRGKIVNLLEKFRKFRCTIKLFNELTVMYLFEVMVLIVYVLIYDDQCQCLRCWGCRWATRKDCSQLDLLREST